MVNSFENIAVISFPELSENEFLSIEKKYLNVIYINFFILFFASISIVFLVDFTNIINISAFSFWIYIALIIAFTIQFLILKIGFSKRKYLVRSKDISYKSGLFFMKTTTVPFHRIQHIEINQGPFSRFFNLAVLSVFTAGNSSDDIKIRGIKMTDASKIKEFISTQIDG
jgi:membrane protein YdbS with pleckstrin-like domain